MAYDFKSEYGLSEISNESVHKFVFDSLEKDEGLLWKYISNYNTGN